MSQFNDSNFFFSQATGLLQNALQRNASITEEGKGAAQELASWQRMGSCAVASRKKRSIHPESLLDPALMITSDGCTFPGIQRPQ